MDIYKACQTGSLDRIKEIIKIENNDNLDVLLKVDSEGISTLHWAALNGRMEACKYLLDHGVPADIRGGDQEAPAIHWAICKGHVGVVSLLLQYGADWRLADIQGYNSIHVAAQNGQEMVLILLEAFGADLNSPDKAGRTALLWAAYRGHAAVVETLIKSGANLDAQDESGKGPFHWAIIKGQAACAAKLAKAGAAFDLRDVEGKLPADWAKLKQISWFDKLNKITSDYRKSRYKSRGRGLEIIGTVIIPALITPVLLMTFAWIPAPWWWSLLAGSVAVFLMYNFAAHICVPVELSIQDTSFLSYYNYSTLSILIAGTYAYLIPDQISTKPLLSLICAGFAASTGISLYKLKSANPGKLALPRDDFEKAETIRRLGCEGILDKRRFCVTCCIQKPLRSKHCKTCDRCVSKFDHHCPWINNCVGFHNHPDFMTYLYSCIGFSFSFLPLAWNFINSLPITVEERSPSCFLLSNQICFAANSTPMFFWLACFGAFMTFWLLMLAVTQTYQIFRNLTTNEMSNYSRLEYFYPQLFPEDVPFEVIKDSDKSRRYVNVFDSGFLKNYSEFWKAPQNQSFDFDSVKEFKEKDLRRARMRKLKQRKVKGGPLSFFKNHKLSGSDSSIPSVTNIINSLSPKVASNNYKQCSQSCCAHEASAESPRLQSNSSKEPLLEGQNIV